MRLESMTPAQRDAFDEAILRGKKKLFNQELVKSTSMEQCKCSHKNPDANSFTNTQFSFHFRKQCINHKHSSIAGNSENTITSLLQSKRVRSV